MPHLRLKPTAAAWLAIFVVTLLFVPAAARAQLADTYTVRDIQVDTRDQNVNLARDRALMEGQREAYQTLMQRLTAPADWPRLPKISDAELQDIVIDVGIDQEKRSTVRYLATLSVRFKPDAIRRLLRSANIAYAEWRGRPVVVLPVLQGDSGPVPAEAPNPWRDAWKSSAAQGVVPFYVPTAEQTDGTVAAAQAATGAPEVLASLGQRFNAQDQVIAVAVPQRLEGGNAKLDVSIVGSGPVGGLLSGSRSYVGEAGETLDMLFRRAVADIAKTANDGWKSGNLLQYDRSASLAVMVPINGFEDWLALRDRLTRSTPVRSYEVAALSKSEAALVLHYVGDQQQLEAVFVQNGLALTWADDHWVLQTAAARPNAGVR